jgi:hypothetical protein
MDHNSSTAYEELGPTRHLTSCEQPNERRKPSARTARIIGELGLRYRPSAAADLEAHAASLALLTQDVAHMPEDQLERAAQEWARTQRFMPKASELIALCHKPRHGTDPERQARLRQNCETANAHLASIGRSDVHWVIRGDETAIEWKYPPNRNV